MGLREEWNGTIYGPKDVLQQLVFAMAGDNGPLNSAIQGAYESWVCIGEDFKSLHYGCWTNAMRWHIPLSLEVLATAFPQVLIAAEWICTDDELVGRYVFERGQCTLDQMWGWHETPPPLPREYDISPLQRNCDPLPDWDTIRQEVERSKNPVENQKRQQWYRLQDAFRKAGLLTYRQGEHLVVIAYDDPYHPVLDTDGIIGKYEEGQVTASAVVGWFCLNGLATDKPLDLRPECSHCSRGKQEVEELCYGCYFDKQHALRRDEPWPPERKRAGPPEGWSEPPF